MGDWREIVSMIGTVILMIAVFAGAYYASKYVGKRYQPRSGASKNLSVLESQTLGKDRSLLIVKAANKVFLVGATPHEITLISELDAQQISESTENVPARKDFSSVLRSALVNRKTHDEGEKR